MQPGAGRYKYECAAVTQLGYPPTSGWTGRARLMHPEEVACVLAAQWEQAKDEDKPAGSRGFRVTKHAFSWIPKWRDIPMPDTKWRSSEAEQYGQPKVIKEKGRKLNAWQRAKIAVDSVEPQRGCHHPNEVKEGDEEVACKACGEKATLERARRFMATRCEVRARQQGEPGQKARKKKGMTPLQRAQEGINGKEATKGCHDLEKVERGDHQVRCRACGLSEEIQRAVQFSRKRCEIRAQQQGEPEARTLKSKHNKDGTKTKEQIKEERQKRNKEYKKKKYAEEKSKRGKGEVRRHKPRGDQRRKVQ
jgi:hypothetical protein